MPSRFHTLASVLATLALSAIAVRAQGPMAELKFADFNTSKTHYDKVVAPFLEKHCLACHGPKREDGELAFHVLSADMKATASGARWAMVREKLTTGEMPPETRARPDPDAVQAVLAWIGGEMKRSGKLFTRRSAFANGNQTPHHALFDPKLAAAFDNPARVRRLSPELYSGFANDVGGKNLNLGQPFTPEGRAGFKDMGAPKIDEPVTAQLIRNALMLVDRQLAHKVEGGKYKPNMGASKELVALLDEKNPLTPAKLDEAVKTHFQKVLNRAPTAEERTRFAALIEKSVKDAGRDAGVRYALAAAYLLPEAVYRWEVGSGTPDALGRVRLSPREIAYALAFTLGDRRPDNALLALADQGKLDSAEGVATAARKLLDDKKFEKPRIMRFFREYFDYEKAREVFKEDKAYPDHDARVLVEDTDRLIEYVLEQDRDVLKELLTTNKAFVAYKTGADTKKKRAAALAQFEERKKKEPEKFKNKSPQKVGRSVYDAYGLTDFPDQQPVALPPEQRAGILTQPAWLVAFSVNDHSHAIFRGKWIRERLLGGVVPDVPITVDAQLPEDPHKTLRQRMEVTQQAYCWKCHQLMNPLGLTFESYDHLGRFRTEEQKKPVDATGKIDGKLDAKLEGDVANGIELLRKLAASEKVEQVFVRHAFRFFLGRNETLGDAKSLQAAHRAYRESQGSMKALIAALVSSDSFLYRVPSVEKKTP